MQEQSQEKQQQTVYVAYGENANAEINNIQNFLKKEGLTVVHKKNIVEQAGKTIPFVGSEPIAATPFVGDELTIAFKYAQAVIVLLTGEEKVRLCKKFQRKDDKEFEKAFCLQPTQEQIFEAGYALGISPRRTILVQIGDARPFSDIAGRHVLHFTGTNEDYILLRTRLRLAGCMIGADPRTSIVPSSNTAKEDGHRSSDPQTVFVVHGRDIAAKSAMFAFLRSLKLTPIEWGQAVELAKMGSPYTGEAVVAGIDEAQAVVVLLTSDDLVQLENPDVIGQLLRCSQARPNVLFEAGMAFSRCKERTILVQLGNVRPCRDMEGRSMIKLTNKSTSRWNLIKRLSNADCLVQLDGTWDSSGNFEAGTCS